MDGDEREARRPLEGAARKFLKEALEANAAGGPTDPSWQDLIDALPDHNQTMIDAIEGESPGLSDAVTELMGIESDTAATAWTALVNQIFDLAEAMYEEGGPDE